MSETTSKIVTYQLLDGTGEQVVKEVTYQLLDNKGPQVVKAVTYMLLVPPSTNKSNFFFAA